MTNGSAIGSVGVRKKGVQTNSFLDILVNLANAKGGYSKQEKILTFCVVNKFEIPKLKEVVHDIDPKAFIVTEDVHEVEGVRVKKRH